MKFGIDVHGPQRMSPNEFVEPMTFPLAALAGQKFHLSIEISQHLPELI